MYCTNCAADTLSIKDHDTGSTSCGTCGKILHEDYLTDGPAFEKTSDGQARLSGTIHRVAAEYSASHEATLGLGRSEIGRIVDGLSMAGGDSVVNPAYSLYKIAVERGFTRGRTRPHVAAACLYIVCRQRDLAYLLIDFSNQIRSSVYVLGAVFLQLCQLLSLEEHPIVQKPVDPSLFMDRFTTRLLGGDDRQVVRQVTNTALNIIASMKRDWMQTGRKPSGLCGAALYIAVHSHQLTYSKSAVVSVVHVCEATLTKRLVEFEGTESGGLTIEELNEIEEESKRERQRNRRPDGLSGGAKELLCQHKGGSQPHYAHGLCEKCYDEFVEVSGGLEGGAEPPAFQRAERKRKGQQMVKRNERSKNFDGRQSFGCRRNDADKQQQTSMSAKDEDNDNDDGTDGFSDTELDGYLNTELERDYKKLIWEAMNREYLEEEAAKEAHKAAEEKAREAHRAKYGDDADLYASSAAAAARSRKAKREKRVEEERKAGPPKNAAEAASRMLKRKTPGSKINFAALEALFGSEGEGGGKRQEVGGGPDEAVVGDGEDGDGVSRSNVDGDEDAAMQGMEDFREDGYDGGGGYDGGYDEEYNYGDEEECDFF